MNIRELVTRSAISGSIAAVSFLAVRGLIKALTERRRVACQNGQYMLAVRDFGERHDVREFVQPHDAQVQALYQEIGPDAWQCYRWVCENISYAREMGEFWQYPYETLARGSGDCFTEDTKIVTLNPEGRYEAKPIAELSHHEGYQALSYDFGEQRFCFQPIIDFIPKGYRSVYRVSLRNGTSFKCTLDHRFFADDGEPISLSSINRNQTIYCARRIPALNWNSHITSDELWLSGLYLAEGYPKQHGSTCLCLANDNPTIQTNVIKCLDRLGMSYSPPTRKRHAYITIRKQNRASKAGYVKKRLLEMGSNSMDKHMPDEFLSLNRKQLVTLLEGFIRGDGYYPKRGKIHQPVRFSTKPRGNRPKPRLMHSTSSSNLASQIRLAPLILGRPIYTYYQKHHGGVGKHPIWRLYENNNSRFNKPTLHDLSHVSIKSVEPCGEEPVYDITVANTHNFLLADTSVLAHNCEDTSLLLASLLNNFSTSYVVLGEYLGYGHAWVQLDNQIFETTLSSPIIVNDPANYCAHAYFNEKIAIELWSGALEELFQLRRNELAKLRLIAGT